MGRYTFGWEFHSAIPGIGQDSGRSLCVTSYRFWAFAGIGVTAEEGRDMGGSGQKVEPPMVAARRAAEAPPERPARASGGQKKTAAPSPERPLQERGSGRAYLPLPASASVVMRICTSSLTFGT